jgi:phage major head subunit gpT-like protein
MLNSRQIAYLESLGLPSGASQVQIDAFAQTLGAGQANFLGQLAAWTQASPSASPGQAEGAATPPATNATTPPPAATTPPASPEGSAVASPTVLTPAALPDLQAQVQAAARGERNRVAHAQTVARQLGLGESWAQAQVDGGFSAEQINGAAVQQAAANRPPVPMGAGNAQVGTDRHGAAVAQGLVDAMLQRSGTPLLALDAASGMPDVRWDGQANRPVLGQVRQAHAFAGRFRGNALMMASTYLQMCGRDVSGMSAPQIARGAFIDCPRVNFQGAAGMMTTSDFPGLLANAMGISMQARYSMAPSQWRIFAAEAPASDFREQALIRLGGLPILPEVKEGGEYTYVSFGEEKETWTLAKRGYIVSLSWEMILNDQLGAFNRVIEMEGDASARTDDVLAFAVITANAAMGDTGVLFNATAVTTLGGHANYVAHGSGAAPSVTTLNAMESAFGGQPLPKKNLNDTAIYLNVMPGVLIVPRALKATATTLMGSIYDPAGVAGTLTPNPWNGRLQIASHRLLDAADPAAWYACTSPNDQPAMILGYLDGFRGPQLTQESGFDTDCRKFKISHCRVAKATDWRLWYGNNGN